MALLDPPAASSFPGNRLMGEVKLFAPMAGTSTRNDPCPPAREANGIAIDPPLSGVLPSHRRRRGAAYFISRTNSPFAKTRKMKNAMKKAKTFTPMK